MTTRLLAIVAVVAASWFIGAAVLMNVVGAVHAWWRFIPTMPYTVALKVMVIVVIAEIFSGVLKALVEADS